MKKFELLVLVVLMSAGVMAQVPALDAFTPSFGSGDNVIKNMMGEVFVVLDQSYRLKDSKGQVYNTRERNDFSSVASIGVRTCGGVVFSAAVMAPWDYDVEYSDEVKQSYTPVRYHTRCRLLADTAIRGTWAEDIDADTLLEGLIYRCDDTLFDGVGLQVDVEKGVKKGYMVWVMVDDSVRMTSPVTVVEQRELTVKEESLYAIPSPLDDKFKSMLYAGGEKTIVGGAFVVPVYEPVGTMTLKLCGMAVKVSGKWMLATSLQGVADGRNTPKVVRPGLVPVEPSDVKEEAEKDDVGDIQASPNPIKNAKQGRRVNK